MAALLARGAGPPSRTAPLPLPPRYSAAVRGSCAEIRLVFSGVSCLFKVISRTYIPCPPELRSRGVVDRDFPHAQRVVQVRVKWLPGEDAGSNKRGSFDRVTPLLLCSLRNILIFLKGKNPVGVGRAAARRGREGPEGALSFAPSLPLSQLTPGAEGNLLIAKSLWKTSFAGGTFAPGCSHMH